MGASKSLPKIKYNLAYSLIYRLSTFLIPLITTPYVSRVLGSANSGIYNYTYTIAQYFVIFGCFGFENYGNRQMAQARDDSEKLNRTFSSLFGLQIITSSLALCGYLIYLWLINDKYPIYMVISTLYVISTLFNITWVYYGLEKFKNIAIRSILIRLVGFILIVTLVKAEEDIGKYIIILAVLELINQMVLWGHLTNYVQFIRVRWKDVLAHVKGCTILFIPILLFSVYSLMDKSMLGQLSSMEETGLYSYALKIVELPFHFITAIGVVMLPRTTNLVANGQIEKSKLYIEKTLRYNTLLGSAMCFGLIAVSKDLSIIFLGKEYIHCAVLICIMAPMIIVRAWANVIRTQYLMPNSMDLPYILSLVAGVIVNFVLNLILIVPYGASGAAFATLITESVVALIQIIAVVKKLPVWNYIKVNLFFLLFGIIMLFGVRLVYNLVHGTLLALIIQVAFGVALYATISIAYLRSLNDPLLNSIFIKIKKA